MRDPLRIVCCTLLLASLSTGRAFAEEGAPDAETTLRQLFPRLEVTAVHATPISGLFEVVAGENVLYFAPATGHLLFGELWSKEGVSLTAARRERLLAEKVARLPLDRAVKLGDGPTVVIEVTDPDCPFCRRGSDYLETRSDVTRYVFFRPLPSHPQARAKAEYILAAPDPAAAYAEVFSGRYDEDPLPGFKPTSRLEEHVSLVEELGVRGTPHYWISGEHVAGADLDAIRNLLP